LVIDQIIKVYVKTHFMLGEEYPKFGKWGMLLFTENNGMAFGMEIAGSYGKLILSSFRIIAVIAMFWYLADLVKKQTNQGFILSIALIIAGAIGNIIDSCFYGMIFTSGVCSQSHLTPFGQGYAGFLHGKVVDMFYFPILQGHFPTWLPIWGGEEYIFFRPIFNFSDAAISVGVICILLFQRNYFMGHETHPNAEVGTLNTEVGTPNAEVEAGSASND